MFSRRPPRLVTARLCALSAALALTIPSHADAATRAPHVLKIIHGSDRAASSASGVTIESLDHRRSTTGIKLGDLLDNVYVHVPADDTVVVASPDGRDTLTLQPQTVAFFQDNGNREVVRVIAGHVDDDDAYGFFSHVTTQGGIVLTAPLDPLFSVRVSSTEVEVASKNGSILATVGSSVSNGPSFAGIAQALTATVGRVDNVTPSRALRYGIGTSTTADVTLDSDTIPANRGDATAEFNLGARYHDGQGVPKDYATALHWFQLAAAQGLAVAENSVGFMHEYGHGVPQDYAAALHWYRLAAARGDLLPHRTTSAPLLRRPRRSAGLRRRAALVPTRRCSGRRGRTVQHRLPLLTTATAFRRTTPPRCTGSNSPPLWASLPHRTTSAFSTIHGLGVPKDAAAALLLVPTRRRSKGLATAQDNIGSSTRAATAFRKTTPPRSTGINSPRRREPRCRTIRYRLPLRARSRRPAGLRQLRCTGIDSRPLKASLPRRTTSVSCTIYGHGVPQ
jgi:hypothetical protein